MRSRRPERNTAKSLPLFKDIPPAADGEAWPPDRFGRILISETDIRRRVRELGREISLAYQGRSLTLVSILKGSVVFLADLIRSLTVPCAVDFMAVSAYGRGRSAGAPRLVLDLRESPEGKDILLIEDIVDTGRTLAFLMNLLKTRGATSLKVCAFLDKPDRREMPVTADFRGFTVPDEFVVGYGLDYKEHYRSLPFIGALKQPARQ
jgi:hypoxanthine phosphoribosyltransferase